MYTIGIDSGSRMTKLCLFDIRHQQIVDCYKEETEENHEELLNKIVSFILDKNKVEHATVKSIVCTGYGRKNYTKADRFTSEIICHAKGVNFLNKNIKTIIDIGGQDSKIIKLSDNGKVLDFVMNDKCAAGTGRFLEKVAQILKVDIADLSLRDCRDAACHILSLRGTKIIERSGLGVSQSRKDIEISSTCVVFAESEIIGMINRGISKEDIIRAVHKSIAHRVFGMSGNIGIEPPVSFVGGVALNKGMVSAFEENMDIDIFVPEMADMTGAIGAALVKGKDKVS